MNKQDRLIDISITLIVILGIFLGWKFSAFSNIQGFKLLNLIGVSYDLVGVLLLTYAILAKHEIQGKGRKGDATL